ncbi:MAG: hypothetical protein NTW36_00780 [Planctomycetia bacterium]|nr:hypothetical protein [Planctomycetia bacterium]
MSKLSGWFPPDQPPCAAVTFAAGDVLLLPDSSWAEDMWAAVDRARQAGVALGVVQHDFIPIRHPELVPPKSTKIFRKWMEATLGRADFVMAVSQSVAAETRAELLRLGRAEVARCGVSSFRNGADFLDEADVQPPVDFRRSAAIRRSLVDFLHGGTAAPYLTVGTIEPRKNQALLLQAIDRVRAEAPDARFLLAGLIGWEGQSVVDALRDHPAWGHAILPRSSSHLLPRAMACRSWRPLREICGFSPLISRCIARSAAAVACISIRTIRVSLPIC